MIDRIVTVEIILATTFALGFIVAHLIARPWRTTAGRLVLTFMASLGLLPVLAMIRMCTGNGAEWRTWSRLASWTLIMIIFAGVMVAQIVILIKGRDRGEACQQVVDSCAHDPLAGLGADRQFRQ